MAWRSTTREGGAAPNLSRPKHASLEGKKKDSKYPGLLATSRAATHQKGLRYLPSALHPGADFNHLTNWNQKGEPPPSPSPARPPRLLARPTGRQRGRPSSSNRHDPEASLLEAREKRAGGRRERACGKRREVVTSDHCRSRKLKKPVQD